MHTRDEKIGKRAARRDRRGPENSMHALNSVGETTEFSTYLYIVCKNL